MRTRVIVRAGLLLLTGWLAACAPAHYGAAARYPGPYAAVNPYGFRGPRAEGMGAVDAVGRWDNVMLLPSGAPVQVLLFDGGKPAGKVIAADAEAVSLVTASGDVRLARTAVMRVDRLPPPPSEDYGRAAARGAATGAGIVGIMGILVGHVPPARVFGGSALAGAWSAAADTAYGRGTVMIYLAPPRGPQENHR